MSIDLCKMNKKSFSKNLTNKAFVNIIASVAKGNRGKPRIITVKTGGDYSSETDQKTTNARNKENFYV